MSLLSITPAGRQLYELVLAAHHDRIRTLIDSDEATLRHVLQVLGAIRDRYEQHLNARATQTSSSFTVPADDAAKAE